MGANSVRETTVNEINDLVTTVFTNIALNCRQDTESTQVIDLECTPQLQGPTATSAPYENNPACQACIERVRSDKLAEYATVESLWTTRPATVPKPIDQDFREAIDALITCGKTFCKACVYENLSQSTLIRAVTDCEAFNDIENKLTQSITDNVTQKLTDNKDMFATLARFFGGNSSQRIITNVSNRISAKINQNVVNAVQNQISNSQNITANGGDIQGASQQSAYTSIVHYFEQTNLFNNIFSDADWDILQDLYNQQSTIDDLGNLVVAATSDFSKLITNVVGQVMIFVIILVIVLFISICLYAIGMAIRKAVRQQTSQDLIERQQAATLPLWEQF